MQKKTTNSVEKDLREARKIIAEYQRCVEDTYIDVRITVLGKSTKEETKCECRVDRTSDFLLTFNFIELH